MDSDRLADDILFIYFRGCIESLHHIGESCPRISPLGFASV
jgi:hypothetical protein